MHNFNMLQIFRTCTFGKDDLQCFIQSETTFFLPDRDEMKIPCGKPDMHLLFEDNKSFELVVSKEKINFNFNE